MINRPSPRPPGPRPLPLCPPGWADEAMSCWTDFQKLQKIIRDTMAMDLACIDVQICNLQQEVKHLNEEVKKLKEQIKALTPAQPASAEYKAYVDQELTKIRREMASEEDTESEGAKHKPRRK